VSFGLNIIHPVGVIQMAGYLSKFLYVLGGRRKALLVLICLAIFTSILETVGIGLVGPFVAIATNPEAIQTNAWIKGIYQALNLSSPLQFVIFLGVIVIAIFYIKSSLSFYIQKYIFDFGFQQRSDLAIRLLKAYAKAPYTYHLGQNSAVLIQNLINETEAFSYKVLLPSLFACSNSIVILAIVILLVKTNALALVVIAGILLVSWVILSQFKHRIAHWGKERSESYEEMIRIINHSLGGIKEVRVIGCEDHFAQQGKIQMDRHAVSGASYLAFSNLPRYIVEAFLVTFLVGFTVIFLMTQQQNGTSLNSVLGIFAMASIRLLPAVGNVISSLNDVRYASYSLDKLYSDLKFLEKIKLADPASLTRADQLGGTTAAVMPFSQQLSLQNVVYRYPTVAEDALKGVSLTLKKGEAIGLIGRSGAGKTTLVDVILGLLMPSAGDIVVDGISIYPDLRAWQNLIGYVPQSIFLIDDTLARNIAFGVPDHLIDPQKLAQAIQTAQLTELVDQLPEGMQTVIGERGVRLSGGQRQRIGIARVIYHDRQILILDEATAALDNETESLVSDAVKALGGTKTMIIIAHRLTTVEHCNRIYLMEQGQIIKSGSYQEVVLSEAALLPAESN
jgi:ATP-binding cassette, subfamily B, bacterial PglK